jgi:hypothetical protein
MSAPCLIHQLGLLWAGWLPRKLGSRLQIHLPGPDDHVAVAPEVEEN